MKEYSLDKFEKEKFRIKDAMRRGMCLLLALIMLFPAGVFAADVDVALVNEAYKEIILWKTDISQFRSAIWWTKDGGPRDTEHPIYNENARTTAFFLSALMERLKIAHTLEGNKDNDADGIYTVTATVLGKKYKIEIQGEHGETWTVNDKPPYEEIPEDSEAEKLQFQYEIDKLVKEIKAEGGILKRLEATNAEITDSTDPIKPAKVTVEELKVISSKLVEYGKEIQGYEDKVVSITLQTIGVPGVDFVAIDETIVSLRNKLTEAETKALERGRELEIEANNAAKDALNQQIIEITNALNVISTKLDEFQIESADLKTLNEIKGSLGRYEREVDGYDLRVETIEKLAESLPNTEPTIDFGETKDKITSVRDKIKEVNNKLNSELEKAANAENATKAVIDAETGVNQYLNGQITSDAIQKLVEEAKEKVNNLTNSQLKNDLNNRLNEVWVKRLAIQAVNTAVADMEDLLDKDTITKEEIADIVAKENAEYKNEITKAYFAAIEDVDAIGTALKTRIIEIQKVLDAIVVADEMDREVDIKPARAIVKKIGSKYENIKNALNAYIDEKEEDIINGEANALLDDAKEAIQAAYDLLIKKFDDGDNKYSTTDVTEAIKKAKAAIKKVKDSLEVIKMNRVIEGVEDTQKAKDAVAKVEVTELRKDYTSADKLVTAITEREEFDGYIDGNFIAIKQGLINQLKIVLPKIETEEAKVAVTKVENSLTQKDLDAAKEAVEKNGVKAFDENQYNVLKEKLDVVEAVIFITNEVADAERNSEEYVTEDVIKGITNIDNQIFGIVNGIKNSLVEEIEKIPNATTAMVNRRSDLTNRLNTLDNVWEGIVAVRYAEYIYKEVGNSEPTLTNAIKFANTKIPDVGNSKVKKDLEKRIETIVNELAANDSYEEANNKVTAIEGILQSKLVISLPKLVDGTDGPIESHSKFDDYIETLESDIKVANDLIKSVKDKTKSTALKNRMAAIINAKDTAKLIVIAEKSHPSYVKKEITAAEKAVAKVADNGIYKDIKDNFLARINFLNIEFNKKAAYDNAKKLVDKASTSLRESDILKAIDGVSALEFEQHKTELNLEINEIVKNLKKLAEDDIYSTIISIELNDKTISKKVSAAKKSVTLFKTIVTRADGKLPALDDLGKYIGIYNDDITIFENNTIAIDRAIQVDTSIKQADKSKIQEDLDKANVALENLETAISDGKVGAIDKGKYATIVSNLRKRIDDIKSYLEGEEKNQDDARAAIKEAEFSLRGDDGTVAGDVYKKEALRGKLTERIGIAQVSINSIKDKTVQKSLQADLNKIIVGRDAITAVNRAKENTTSANVKAAISAVKKISNDYGTVIVELEKEIGELEKILSMLEEAGKAAKLVETAESTKKQNDYDKAKTAVDLLRDGEPKKLLLERLEKVLAYIEGEATKDSAAIEAAEAALNKALLNITQANIIKVNPTVDEINRAYELLEGVEEIQNGTLVVIKDGAEHFLKEAKDEVKKITLDLTRKNMLNEIIIQREAQIILAKEKIHIKEAARLVDIAARSASKLVNLPEDVADDVRQEAELAARRDAEAARIVIGQINSPENLLAKQELQSSLERIEGTLAAKDAAEIVALATSAVEEAFRYVSIAAASREEGKASLREDIEAAEMKIRAANRQIAVIPDVRAKDREDLTESINSATNRLQNIIDGISDEETIARALEAIEEAKKRVEAKDPDAAYYITAARIIVNSIINETKRAELTAILDALLVAIDDGTGVIDDGRNDKDKLAAAVKAVEAAEASKLQKDVDAARKLVNDLVDGPTKDSLNKRLDAIVVVGINKPGDNTGGNNSGGNSGSNGKGNGINEDPRPVRERDTSNPDPKWGDEKGFKKK